MVKHEQMIELQIFILRPAWIDVADIQTEYAHQNVDKTVNKKPTNAVLLK